MITSKQLERFLRGMGKTADDVTALLRANEVKGVPTDPFRCAVAGFVEGALGVSVVVDHFAVTLPWVRASAPTTEAICRFITQFDRGEYPDLIEGNQ